jgi:hypothetical protein
MQCNACACWLQLLLLHHGLGGNLHQPQHAYLRVSEVLHVCLHQDCQLLDGACIQHDWMDMKFNTIVIFMPASFVVESTCREMLVMHMHG